MPSAIAGSFAEKNTYPDPSRYLMLSQCLSQAHVCFKSQ